MICISTKRHQRAILATLILMVSAFFTLPAAAGFFQQGSKLVGAGATGESYQGRSVAISADGNTAIVGGSNDADGAGAAWVFVRSNGVWTPQSGKLVGANAIGVTVYQGYAVALSADGNTAIVGGQYDNNGVGAVWVFVRTNGTWSPQGGKLVATDYVGASRQGWSVALSADGNTAIVGGVGDNSSKGAAWIFTRSAGIWKQQGNKLFGANAVGTSYQGHSVSLSGDGNTAIVGGYGDDSFVGAAWVFTRSAGTWSQFGNKLVGTGYSGSPNQGGSVSLAADGKTAAVGGPGDSSNLGAAWAFTFDGTTWSQQGGKIVGTGGGAAAQQAYAVSLSSDGNTLVSGAQSDTSGFGAIYVFGRNNGVWSQRGDRIFGIGSTSTTHLGSSAAVSSDGSTAIAGGYNDNSAVGAAWIFTRRTPHDFGGNGRSDILWRNTGGDIAMWQMNGAAASSVAGLGNIGANWIPAGQRDFNADGKTDILWRDSSGATAMWMMNGASAIQVASLGSIGANWYVAGTGDFDGDGKGDILWRNSDGTVAVWLMNGTSVTSVAVLGTVATYWTIYSTADFDGDGKADLLWRNTGGSNAIWLMNGTAAPSVSVIGSVAPNWTPVATADFDGDGKGDILWRNSDGTNAIWFMNRTTVSSVALIGGVGTSWSVASAGDYDGDGKGDILWREAGGSNAIWFMNGATVSSVSLIGGVATNWSVQNAGAN